MAAELALASSGMTRPFPWAIFLAYSNWAGLTGLGSSFPGVSKSAFLGACSLPSGGAAVLQLANDALGDIAHCVDRTDHLLLADNDIVEQAFKLRRHARIDQRWIGPLENSEQREASLGRHGNVR